MLSRHRRRPYLIGIEDGKKPRRLLRAVMIVATVAVLWYGSTAILEFFNLSIGKKTAATLELRSQDGVQVALQGSDWQAAESKLKVYEGDAVATRTAGDAIIHFFDGTKIRLDQNTDVEITDSIHNINGASVLVVHVRSGRVWLDTPVAKVFSGSIVRTVSTTNYSADFPPDSSALIGSQILNVVKASGVGANVTLMTGPSLIVGEGQYFSLEGNAATAIEQGEDPYDFRNPVTTEQLRDEFLVSSFLVMESLGSFDNTVNSNNTSSGSDITTPLTITEPANRTEIRTKTVTVAGRVGERVTRLTINGDAVNVTSDRTFSADISLSKDPTTTIVIEAQDAQGITLSREERTVLNMFKIVVEPPRIKSPAGSGETIRVTNPVVEVTGEAPPGTAAILVNDYRLQLFKAGDKTWSYLANAAYGNLLIGDNIFAVVAVDADGNRSASRTVTVVYEPENTINTGTGETVSSSEPALKQNAPLQPRTLVVEAPKSGTSAETSDAELSILGRTSTDTYSISVNGYTLSLYEPYSPTWKYIASVTLTTMKRGRNVYRIVTRNKGGEILDILEYTITYMP